MQTQIPEHAVICYERACKLLTDGFTSAAVEGFQAAIRICPDYLKAYHHLASAYINQGDAIDALHYLFKAIVIEPDDALFVKDAAGLLSSLGRVDEALDLCRNYLAHHPSNHDINFILSSMSLSEKQISTFQTRRLLVTIDYSVQPYNIGDLIVYQTASLIIAQQNHITTVDYCFISDPSIAPLEPSIQQLINRHNRWAHVFSIIPVVQLTPGIGSVFVYDSHDKYRKFIADNELDYYLWPAPEQLDQNEYLFYPAFRRIAEYHENQGSIPQLFFYEELTKWSYNFFQSFSAQSVPVTINLRNNRLFHVNRNSNIPAWKGLFDYCRIKYNVTFIIACGVSEIDEEIKKCPNVVYAKEHHTNIVQDLALIYHSAFHLGSASGPSILSAFNTKPYFIANCGDMLPHIKLYEGSLLKETNDSLKYSFASPLQSFGLGIETTERLILEFEKIWCSHDWQKLLDAREGTRDDKGEHNLTWLQ